MSLGPNLILAALVSPLRVKSILLLFECWRSTCNLHTQLFSLRLFDLFVLKHLFLLEAHVVATCIKMVLDGCCIETESVVWVFVVIVNCWVWIANATVFLARSGFARGQVLVPVIMLFLPLVVSCGRTVSCLRTLLASASGSVVNWASHRRQFKFKFNANLDSRLCQPKSDRYYLANARCNVILRTAHQLNQHSGQCQRY